MPAPFAYDVFLSHNSKDKPRVRRLAERLKQAGLRVWFDEWSVRSGDIIALKVDEGLEQSRVLLLCLSPNALASGWMALERSTAIHRDPSNEGRRFIPLLLADCDLPDTLRRYKYVDFRRESKEAFAQLLTAFQLDSVETPSTGSRLSRKKQTIKKLKPAVPHEEIKPLAVLERILSGHTAAVSSVAISPDGSWAASGSKDKLIKIWNLDSGVCRATFSAHLAPVTAVSVTPNGKNILSASSDGTLRLWSADSGRPLANFAADTAGASPIAKLLDDNHAIYVGKGSFCRLSLRTKARCEIVKWRGGNVTAISCIDVYRDGSRALTGDQKGNVCLWDLKTGNGLINLKGHLDAVTVVEIASDERFAVSGSCDKTLRIWNLEAGKCIGTLEGHEERVTSVAISKDGALIASTEFDSETVRLWDCRTGACLQIIRNGEFTRRESALSLSFSRDGSRLLVSFASSMIPQLLARMVGDVARAVKRREHNSQIHVYRLSGIRSLTIAEPSLRYVNAKVVLLGEGTVGKTSLAHRLIEDKYVVRDRTHGMNVWRLELPLPPDATLEREALLWDLAGQEDYRLIHQLFLEETALALLLINPQKDDPFFEAGDWLKALKTAANRPESAQEAARLLVFSQIDVGGMKLGKAKIERLRGQYGFANWLATSAKTGENCSDKENGDQPSKLKQLIAASIPWDKLPWTSTPRLLAELKNAVVAMRDERDIRLLRFAELTQRLEQALPGEKFGESDVRTAVTLLANHGLARPLKFGDLVLLQPELLNGYAGAIIRAARAHTDEIGCVLEADIYQPGFDFTGVERLKHRPDEELLLRALVQTFFDRSLCIAEETPHGRHLVFPSQYRREKDLPRDPDIFVSYTFSGEWQTVWTTLVVRLWCSQGFEPRELWRNAAEFASGKGHTLGLKIDNRQGEGTATISLYFDKDVPDELRAIFIEYVHRHLARYGCEVSRDRRYVCPDCGKPVKDLDAVRKRLEARKDFITCQECDEKVPLMDFIEQRLKSDPVARKILAMDETATRELDTQALEQILIGHMMAIAGEANQIFRPVTMFDHGIDGEVEFKDNDGKASGKRIYIQLKSGNSYLRTRKGDGSEVFDVKDDRHLEYWISQPVDVYLVIRQTDETSGGQVIRWMNVTRYLKARTDKKSRQIIFDGEKLDMEAVWKVRDGFISR